MRGERALVIVDERVEPGQYHVGGVVVLARTSDAERGWAVVAKPVRVHDEQAAVELEAELDRLGHTHRRLVDGRLV